MGNKTTSISDTSTLWSFDLVQDTSGNPAPGGLILQNMRHDSHNYARDVRVVGIWLKLELFDPSSSKATALPARFVTLSPKWFDSDTVKGNAFSASGSDDVSMLNYFTTAFGLKAIYASTKDVFDGLTNCQHGYLLITQFWIFSPYGKSPPHEPSGGLSAARFHPLVKYKLEDSTSWDKNKPYTRVSSIRFDYRLHLHVDRSESDPDAATATPSNHAGLFRDRDVPPLSTKAGSSGAGFTYVAFEAAEKPLALEVVAPALYQGLPVKDVGAASGGTPRKQLELCWDNIHWWGHRKSGHISAPGAFHAIHMHWRWGAPIAMAGGLATTLGQAPDAVPNPGNFLPPLPTVLRADDYIQNGTIYGPLVDPSIWTQTIYVAVTKYDKKMDPDQVDPSKCSTETFQDLFTNRGTPQDIYSGADCVLWYSTEIPREVDMQIYYSLFDPRGSGQSGATNVPVIASNSGYLFLHGTFFAHDPERTGKFIGDTAELYTQRDLATIQKQQQWYRAPKT